MHFRQQQPLPPPEGEKRAGPGPAPEFELTPHYDALAWAGPADGGADVLDATDRTADHAKAPADSADFAAPAEGPEAGPVFVDSSGRRARLVRRAGWALGAACSVYTAGLLLSLTGATPFAPKTLLPLPGVPSVAPADEEEAAEDEAADDEEQAGPAPGQLVDTVEVPPGYVAPQVPAVFAPHFVPGVSKPTPSPAPGPSASGNLPVTVPGAASPSPSGLTIPRPGGNSPGPVTPAPSVEPPAVIGTPEATTPPPVPPVESPPAETTPPPAETPSAAPSPDPGPGAGESPQAAQ